MFYGADIIILNQGTESLFFFRSKRNIGAASNNLKIRSHAFFCSQTTPRVDVERRCGRSPIGRTPGRNPDRAAKQVAATKVAALVPPRPAKGQNPSDPGHGGSNATWSSYLPLFILAIRPKYA
jgi:hypothetical protein